MGGNGVFFSSPRGERCRGDLTPRRKGDITGARAEPSLARSAISPAKRGRDNPPPAQSAGAPFTQGGLFHAVSAVHIRLCLFGRIIRSYTEESDVMRSALTSRYVRTMPSPTATESPSTSRVVCFFFVLFLSDKEKEHRVLFPKMFTARKSFNARVFSYIDKIH